MAIRVDDLDLADDLIRQAGDVLGEPTLIHLPADCRLIFDSIWLVGSEIIPVPLAGAAQGVAGADENTNYAQQHHRRPFTYS